jgi:hypothetical protein
MPFYYLDCGYFLGGGKEFFFFIKTFYDFPWSYIFLSMARRGRRGRDRMVIRFTSTIYNYLCNRCLEPLKLRVRSWRGVLDTTLCNKVYQWLATSRWFFPGKWQDEISKEKHYVTCYILCNAAAFVRRTTSSTDLHLFLKRSLYLLRFNHLIFYTGCGTFVKRVCHNTRTLLSYLHFYARTCKSIYRLFVLKWSLLLH